METITQTITQELLDEALDYTAYNQLIAKRYEQGRTTNDDNRPNMLEYTKLNIHRTSRWDKKAKIEEQLIEKLQNLPIRMTWLVITEGWCGDSSQIIPFLNKMAECSPKIDLKMILRDQHPEVMDEFLTNGSRSVPKLIALHSETLDILGSWGPRPEEAQQTYLAERADPEIANKTATENLHIWYARNKGKAVQQEFMEYIDSWIDN